MSTTGIGLYRSRGKTKQLSHPVKGTTKIWRNQHLDISTGYARPWPSTATLGLVSGGIAIETIDNTTGVDGDLRVEAESGSFLFPIGSFAVTDLGKMAFGVDEANVQPTNGSGTLSPCGRVEEVILAADPRVALGEHAGVWIAELGNVANNAHKGAYVISVTITEAMFTGVGLTEALNLGGVLPTGAKLRSVDVGEGSVTLFSGGSAATATLSLGVSGTVTALRTAINVFTGATGFPLTGTAGALGFAGADWGGLQLQALLTVTVGTTGGCTAGSITVTVTYDFPGT